MHSPTDCEGVSACEVSVIIPNLNGCALLPGCIASLEKQTLVNFEIILVDNGSTDDSVRYIKSNYPRVRLIELQSNVGFAAACNLGMRAAKGEHIAVLNNDTEVSPQWLESLLNAAAENEEIGMVASKIFLDLETRTLDSAGMLFYPDGIGRQRGRGETDEGQFDQSDILFPSACAALYSRKMLNDVGMFDEDFFAYCEDTDLGLRARLAGWKAVFAPQALVLHKYSSTGGKYSLFKALHVERNRIWVALKILPFSLLLRVPFYSLRRYSVQLYGIFIGQGSSARFKESYSARDILFTIVKAYYLAVKGLFKMMNKRRAIKRNLPTREFIQLLARHRISAAELVMKD